MKKLTGFLLLVIALFIIFKVLKEHENKTMTGEPITEKKDNDTPVHDEAEKMKEKKLKEIGFKELSIPDTPKSKEIYDNLPVYVKKYIHFMEVDNFAD